LERENLADGQQDQLFDLFQRNVREARVDAFIRPVRGPSLAVAQAWQGPPLDLIFIDGDHSYEGASGDARVAASKVKPGGYLVFNDFAHADPYLGAYGVHRAVVEFAVKQGWRFAWWAYEPNGLYDVALQRPATR